MSSQKYITVFVSDKNWQIGIVGPENEAVEIVELLFDAKAILEDKCVVLHEKLTEADAVSLPVMLALESKWCLCSEIDVSELGRPDRRQEMSYLLEEHLPLSAEDIIADYIEYDNTAALGVCCGLSRLHELIAAFDAAEIYISHICPAAVMTAMRMADSQLDHQELEICYEDTGFYDYVIVDSGEIKSWQWLKGKAEIDSGKCFEAAAVEASEIMAGTKSPKIDFRRGPLALSGKFDIYKKSLNILAASVVLLLLALAGSCMIRANKYATLAMEYDYKQVQFYMQLHPDGRPPEVGIKRRLAGEYKRLAGLGGKADDTDATELLALNPSALHVLQDFLASLPQNVKFRILNIDIDGPSLRVDAQALSHAQAELVATALHTTGRYQLQPPRTQTLKDGGVGFVFSAKLLASAQRID